MYQTTVESKEPKQKVGDNNIWTSSITTFPHKISHSNAPIYQVGKLDSDDYRRYIYSWELLYAYSNLQCNPRKKYLAFSGYIKRGNKDFTRHLKVNVSFFASWIKYYVRGERTQVQYPVNELKIYALNEANELRLCTGHVAWKYKKGTNNVFLNNYSLLVHDECMTRWEIDN